jgi:hypothetical protein
VGEQSENGGGRSPDEPVCAQQIPVDSEKNREFSAFLPFSRVALAEIVPLFRTLVQHFPLYENREFLVNETGICEH